MDERMKPVFEHDCTECIYLGSSNEVEGEGVHDFYIHNYKCSSGWYSILARYGNECDEYQSMLYMPATRSYFEDRTDPQHEDYLFCLCVCYRRAVAAGYLKGN